MRPREDDEPGEDRVHRFTEAGDRTRLERARRFLEDPEEPLWVPAGGDRPQGQVRRPAEEDRGDLRRSRPNARVPLRRAWAEGPRGAHRRLGEGRAQDHVRGELRRHPR